MSKMRTNSAVNFLRHHGIIGPSSSNLVEFYSYFGFTDVVAEEIPSGPYIQALSGGAWESAVVVKLRNSHGDTLEVIQPQSTSEGDALVISAGWSHMAFTVGNCDDSVQHVLSAGGFLVGGPITNPDAPFRVAYVRDPAMNLIELVETCDV